MEINTSLMDQAAIQSRVFNELVRILQNNLLVSIPVNFICATIVFISLYKATGNVLIEKWFYAVIFISIFRMLAFYAYQRHSSNSRLHLWIFISGLTLSALLWGIADSILMPKGILLDQMVVIVIVAGVTAGGSQVLNPNLQASLIYVFLIIFPLCAWLYLQPGTAYLLMGITMTFYLVFMLIAAVKGNRILKESLTLQYTNLSLINDLASTNKQLLLSHQILEQHELERSIITAMNEKLQTCSNMREAYVIIHLAAKTLFSDLSGGLAILSSDSKELKIVNQWENGGHLKSDFPATDCWALREGHNYFVNDASHNIMCYHFKSAPMASACFPLLIQSGTIGLFIIYSSVSNALTEHKRQLAAHFSEVIKICLSNIHLRESLYHQATHDPLTGLFNRRCLDDVLVAELLRIVRDKKILYVAMLDVDNFKRFNDVNGHEAGDEVLKFIGSVLKDNIRKTDIACRFGGEEFLIMLNESDLSDAEALIRFEGIRNAVKNGVIYFQNKRLPVLTVSIGFAKAPKDGATLKDIVRAADLALYSAKEAGRDRVEYFQHSGTTAY